MHKAQTGVARTPLWWLAALASVLLLAGCETTPTTRLASTWTQPGSPPKPYRNLVVFGVAAKPTVRQAFESNFVAELQTRGVKAQGGSRLVPAGGLGDVKALRTAVERSGADGVLVVHLAGEHSEDTRVPAGSPGAPRLYDSLYSYYQHVYGYVTEPGYYANYPVLQLETSLYDVGRQKLVWSARSGGMDPAADRPTLKEVISVVAQGLAGAGFLPP